MSLDGATSGDDILEVDLLAFEQGDAAARRAVVDGTLRSLQTGFVYTRHDLPESLIDEAYGLLAAFFALEQSEKERFVAPGAHGQTGYTGLLVETAAGAEHADWKEMLAWGPTVPEAHPLRRRHPLNYRDQVLPEEVVPGITARADDLPRLDPRPAAAVPPHHRRRPRRPRGCSSTTCCATGRTSPAPCATRRWEMHRASTSGPASTPTSAC